MKRVIRGLAVELRPLPMVATITALYFSFLLAKAQFSILGMLFMAETFFCLYTVHFLDTYVDYYVRKEDRFKKFKFAHGASGILKKRELLYGAALSSLAFWLIAAYLSITTGFVVLLASAAVYAIGISYSNLLSKNYVLSLIAYPAALVVAMAGMYYISGGIALGAALPYFAPVFVLLIAGRILMETADVGTDRKTGKPNVALNIGERHAKLLAFLLLIAGLAAALVHAFSLEYLFSLVPVFAVFCAGFASKIQLGTRYVMLGIYIFLIVEILVQYAIIT